MQPSCFQRLFFGEMDTMWHPKARCPLGDLTEVSFSFIWDINLCLPGQKAHPGAGAVTAQWPRLRLGVNKPSSQESCTR